MGIFTLVIILLVIVFIVTLLSGMAGAKTNTDHGDKVREKLNELGITDYANTYVSKFSGMSFAIDNAAAKIHFIDKNLNTNSYDLEKILQCEIDIDGQTIVKTSTSSAVGRAVLGGILTGGVGAIIGGVTASKTHREDINSMDLKIIVSDTAKPIYKVNFFTGKITKDSVLYKLSYPDLEHWHGVLSVIIKGNEANNKQLNFIAPTLLSAADEIKKLKTLMDEGIITQEEFQAQKIKYLS